MDHLVFQAAVLCAMLCFGLPERQGNHVFQLMNLNISMNLPLQQLLLEWDVTDDSKASLSGIEMVFNIQVFRTEENNIVFFENYATALNKSNRPLKWSWYSEVPLECVTHGVRIRGTVTRSGVWSKWSPWKTVDGLDALAGSESYIFPKYKIAEEGSSVTFCCVAKKNISVTGYLYNGVQKNLTRQRRITFAEKNVQRTHSSGNYVICCFSDEAFNVPTRLYVTRQPDVPKDLSCETQNMMNLKCTWNPGQIETYNNLESNCAANFILSDRSDTKTYCNCSQTCQNTCSFEIGNQTIYNLKMTYKNCLGQKVNYLAFDVTHRVRPEAPSHLSGFANATAIYLYWRVNHIKGIPFLLCQISSSSAGEEDQHNVTVQGRADSHPHITLVGLQPSVKYSLKVRCSAANRIFWKWSKWTNTLTIQTNESAPSGQLDIWRDISPGSEERNVTVFWKALPTPSFHANGKIKAYEIFWEKLEEPIVSNQNNSATETKNCKTILLDSHSYKISVSARNSVNTSPPSVIIILATEENGNVNYSEEDTINNTAHSIYISWEPQSKFDGYIVDWCNNPKSHPCDFQWKKFGQNDSSALIFSDAFSSGVRYTFRVYGTQGARSYLLEKKAKYLKELEPTADLDCEISTLTSSSVTITCEPYLQDSQPGFIRGYVVFVKLVHGNCTLEESDQLTFPDTSVVCRYTIQIPHQTRFTVKSLKPSTAYRLAVQAYSVTLPNITDRFLPLTTPSKRNWFLPVLLPLVILPLILVICSCFGKSDSVKKHLFPEIPHPDVTLTLKKSPGPVEIIDCTPDKLIVMEDQTGSVVKWPAPGMLLIENRVYDPSFYPNQQATSKEPHSHLTPYQPLESLFTSFPPETGQGNFSYISLTQATRSVAQQDDAASSVEPRQWPTYKPQLSVGSETNTHGSDHRIIEK